MSTYCEQPAARTDWETPQWLFDALDAEFHFTCDVCAQPHNTKCDYYYTPDQDSLKQEWSGVCWMNPPYGKEIEAFLQKAHETALNWQATVVALVPARTSNEWWKWVIEGEVRFVRGRVRYVGATQDSMFPNAIIVFRPGLEGGGKMKIWYRPEAQL